MSKIIRAIVTTNSSDDEYSRVKVKFDGIWKESDLMESVGGIPLSKDDVVYVDVSEGYNNPLILGRSFDKSNKPATPTEGSLLFESSDGSNWTVAFVKNNKLTVVNSDNTKITVDGKDVLIETTNIKVKCNEFNVNDGNLTVTK